MSRAVNLLEAPSDRLATLYGLSLEAPTRPAHAALHGGQQCGRQQTVQLNECKETVGETLSSRETVRQKKCLVALERGQRAEDAPV
jgi:hypothetical protein